MFILIAFKGCFQHQMAHILFLEWLFFSCPCIFLDAYFFNLFFSICFPGLCSILVLAGFGCHCPALLPHGVEDSSVLHDTEQLVGGGHVVRDRPFAIPEKGVGCPDLADH